MRLTERDIDEQVVALFARMKQQDSDWFTWRIREWSTQQQTSRENIGRIEREMTLRREQQARLLNLRLLDEIDAGTFANKNTELRGRIATLSTQLEATDRSREELADLALRTFELSQSLNDKWLTADFTEKRKMVEIVVLNFSLEGATLVPTINKPFDMLVKGLEVYQVGATGRPLP